MFFSNKHKKNIDIMFICNSLNLGGAEKIMYEIIENIKRSRNNFMDKLNEKGISTRPATHAIHMLSFYKDKYKITPKEIPNSYAANNCSISLPIFNGMSEIEQEYIIENILSHKNII